jgi:hypothetical protein
MSDPTDTVDTMNEAIVNRLLSDLNELLDQRKEHDQDDSFYDYLCGSIDRTQLVLGLLGVSEDEIPTDDEDWR